MALALALELLFIALVVLDLVLTYRVIRSGKGVEKKYWYMTWPIRRRWRTLTGMYIDRPILTYGITIAGVGAIFLLIETSGFFSLYILWNAVFAWACWNSWRVLHGRS